MKLWLDDVRNPRDRKIQKKFGACGDEIWVKTIEEALQWIENPELRITSISFDHDLGEDIPTGYDLAKWFEERAFYGLTAQIEWRVHSANPVGAKNITSAMKNADRFWERRK